MLVGCKKKAARMTVLPFALVRGHLREEAAAATPQTTLAMLAQTWSMFLLLSAATHMRPVSVP